MDWPVSVPRRLLLVHAHPDDETLTTGGTMARYAAAGVQVALVTATLGEQGEVVSPELAGLTAEHADQLGGYRIAELADACAALGVADHRFLGGAGRWRDSGMVVTGDGIRAKAPEPLHPRAFAAPAAFGTQVDALAEVLAELAPQVVVSYDACGGYGHPDHVRAHEVTLAAAARVPGVRRVFATVAARGDVAAGLERLRATPGLPWPVPPVADLPTVPDEEVDVRLDVSTVLAAKLAALRAHASQLTVREGPPPAFALSNGLAQPVAATECFRLLAGPRVRGADLFAGLEP